MLTLEESYERCRQLNRRHGTTYYWSTYLLPRAKRPHVHALYGFCRYADDIVDDIVGPSDGPGPGGGSVAAREDALRRFGDRLFIDLAAGDSEDPVLKAVVHTVRTFGLDPEGFRRFLKSMAMDLSIDRYETYDDLLGYMDGSAAVIGELMLPLLEPSSPAATEPARDLGNAFQLTNFLRDVAEDHDRRRIYLPQEDVRTFGAASAWDQRRVTPEFVELMRFEIDRARCLYRSADRGIELLPPASARCIGAARTLYAGILDRIEAAAYDVWSQRVRVPTWRKLAAAARIGKSIPYGAPPRT